MLSKILFLMLEIITTTELTKKMIMLFKPDNIINQTEDRNRRIPKKYLKLIVHFPDLGIILTILGKSKKSKYGMQNPIEIDKKIRKIIEFDANIEKPTAVPRKGALQGVASNVANIPDKKFPALLFLMVKFEIIF